jgi:hypothetical protein
MRDKILIVRGPSDGDDDRRFASGRRFISASRFRLLHIHSEDMVEIFIGSTG